MRLAIVNRFAPPDPSMTGRMAADLALALRRRFPDWPITLITTDRSYRTATIPPIKDGSIDVIRLPSRSAEHGRLSRLAGSLLDGRALARAAFECADTVIALTDPPLLGVWTGRRARRSGGRWVEWSMDLFPEAFVAARIARRDGIAMRYLMNALRRRPPDFRLALGERQLDHLEKTRGRVEDHAVLPAGILTTVDAGASAPRHQTPLHIGYIGNVGEAHSVEMIARFIELADPERFRFTLAVSGSGAARLADQIGAPSHVTYTDYLEEDAISSIHVHLVSLRKEWIHVSVPSKAITAVMTGRPFMFAGPENSDTWSMLGDAGWRLPSGREEQIEIRQLLDQMADPDIWAIKQRNALRLRESLLVMRENALDRLCGFLSRSHQTWRDQERP